MDFVHIFLSPFKNILNHCLNSIAKDRVPMYVTSQAFCSQTTDHPSKGTCMQLHMHNYIDLLCAWVCCKCRKTGVSGYITDVKIHQAIYKNVVLLLHYSAIYYCVCIRWRNQR